MDVTPKISRVAALIAAPARAAMLNALMDGHARAATDLALAGGVSLQTASGHLALLKEAGLVAVARRGRWRRYRLAGPAVAEALEALRALSVQAVQPAWLPTLRSEPLRLARTCYDHLAGRLGVALADAMVRRRYLEATGREFRLTPSGERFFSRIGVSVEQARAQRRRFAPQCLDWSERRRHLAGSLGAALAARCFEMGWISGTLQSRAVTVTEKGRFWLEHTFSLSFP
ncbi:MAG: ArsR family transcriptional regulator [Deltaproteobacteria bacterium]|jgi:DNA-binding transcriptional ArsR family regulator|nr:ArsR family transcriptional regulator [Deltaproteobacteria bacterium]